MNDAYSGSIYRFVEAINFIAQERSEWRPTQNLGLKAKLCQQYKDGINYKKFKHAGLETDKDNFKVAKMHLQKMILKKKKSYFEEELGKNKNKPKELWKTLKSLGLSSDKTRQSKISLNKEGAIQFEVLENTNTFKVSALN